ncbi:hypothetical protein BH23BAC3_BH23BAC3_16760 [soil metagenome]
MKKFTIKALTMVFIMLSLLLSGCGSNDPVSIDEPDEVETVTFPDALLEAQIRIALDIDDDEDITPDMMLQLEEFNIDASDNFSGDISGIEDLTGLEYAKNLTLLRLSYTSVTDLSPISELENIEYLRFNNTAITDISPISGYTSLTYFNANTVTGLEDMSPLAGNSGLQTAILREVPFGNAGMSTIRQLTSLHRINMRDTGVTDITVLGELMAEGALLDTTPGAIEENGGADLDLRGLSIEDWSPIAPYVDQINDFDGLPANEVVTIPDSELDNVVRSLLGIESGSDVTTLYMTGLDTLNVSGIVSISDLTGLENAPNIRYLRFGETSVTDLTPIADLEKVEYPLQ